MVVDNSSSSKPEGVLARLARVEEIQEEQGRKLDEILKTVLEMNQKL